MNTLYQDLRYSLRNLAKNPSFTLIALLTLALGIGANTAIFSVVNAVLLRPLPYANPDRLVVILHDGRNPASHGNFFDWKRDNHVFENMGAAEAWSPNLTGVDKPEELSGLHISSDILPTLGVQPLLGRTFVDEEDQTGKDHEVILSYQLWQQRFGADHGVLGQTMQLNGEPYTIVGVMPRGFRFAPFWATKAELWSPLQLDPAQRDGYSLRIFARLKTGVTLEQARAEMATISARLEAQFPGSNKNVVVTPLKEKVVGDIRPALLVLLGAVGFVLLIACANVAHMLLARASTRQREIAVRTALGASRARLLRQFLAESALLALAGGCLGLLAATWAMHVVLASAPAEITKFGVIRPDGNVLLFALAVSLITGLAFGLAPALQSSALNLVESLKEGGRGAGDSRRSGRMRNLLVASEFALALVLLTGAGLMIRTFAALQAIDPGFNPHHLLTMVVSTAGAKEAGGTRADFFQRALSQVRSLPGVVSAGAINHLPLGGDTWGFNFWIEGRPIPKKGEEANAVYRVALPGYFRTMNIPMLRGRDFNEHDNQSAPGAVIVNEFLAKRYWAGEDPVGKRLSTDGGKSWLTVTGVIPNVVRSEWTAAPEEEMYIPYLQETTYLSNSSPHFAYMTFVVRASGNAAAQTAAIQSTIHSLDRNVTVSEIETMEEVVADANAQPRFYLYLLAAFAGVALILAAVGIYGVMSHSVSRRTHEMAVRMALGAQQGEVMRLVVGESMLLAVVGGMVGLVGALALTPMMKTLLYGVRASDPITFFSVAFLLAAVALLASYIPARRATKVDPIVALRYE
jgi:predicted permease